MLCIAIPAILAILALPAILAIPAIVLHFRYEVLALPLWYERLLARNLQPLVHP
jgi:hypothetical protein